MIIPIVAGAILGLAFDIKQYKLKEQYIFDDKAVKQNLQIIPKTFTQSQYRMISASSDSSNLLDIDGDLSIKAKKGDIELAGYGKYLENAVDRAKNVEILITVSHETQTETFPSYTKLRTDWQKKPQSNVGTHYIRSITYGGQLIISYLLTANKDEYIEDIKASVTANLAFSGSLDLNVTGKIDKMVNEVKDKCSVSISAYATTGIFNVPTDIQGCLDLVEKYPSMVKALPGGKGAPLKVDIVELSTINPNYSEYLKNEALDAMLDGEMNRLDDMELCYESFNNWEEKTSMWDPKWDEAIDDFRNRMNEARDAMLDAIGNLDATKGYEQFDEANRLYGENEQNIPSRYMREFKNLTYHVEGKPFYWFPYTTAVSSYVHWGSQNCTLPSPEPLFVGYAASAPVGFGNGGNIECLPGNKPALVPKNIGDNPRSEINGLFFELPDKKSGQALCAFCKLENATVAYTISGRNDCPEDMKLEYNGFLMASRDAGTGSEFICMDKNPDESVPADNSKAAESLTASLNPVWTICPDCDEEDNMRYVSCAVCSR